MKGSIGEKICRYRQMKKMTQEELASRLGVTPQAVSKWERGNGLPDVSLIEGICKILNISANSLLGIETKVVENGNAIAEQEIRNNLIAEPLVLEFGENVVPCIARGLETDYLNLKRKELVKRTGILMPILRVRDNLELEEDSYRIISYDRVLFEDKTDDLGETAYREIIDQVTIVCKSNYANIINKQLVKTMVDTVKELYPGVVDGLVPEKISYLQVERKLQDILRQGGSLRDMIHILEELEEENYSELH